ncbi:MAG: hypothetical protein FWD48_03935 [Oscillospiraceae bacterium]|nr:hypothetical protein [Oscillospiraceae bacterium]
MNTEKTNTKTRAPASQNRYMQEWKNFYFFLCGEEAKQSATQLLIDRDYLLPTEQPNQEKITSEARYFAASLAERLKGNRNARRFGLSGIAENIGTLTALQDLSLLYFYIGNLYGSVLWRMPYNLQRLAVNHDALGMYLNVFADTFTECANKEEPEADTGEQEGQLYEEN